MPKVTGPLLSLKASGNYADVLTFKSQPNGKTIAHFPAKNRLTQSTNQLRIQRYVAGLIEAWHAEPAIHSAWHALAKKDHISNYNAYLKFNLYRRTHSKYPTTNPSPSNAVPTNTISGQSGNIDGHYINWIFTLSGAGTGEWVALFQSLTNGFTPGLATQITLQYKTNLTFRTGPHPVGVNWFRYLLYSSNGGSSGAFAQVQRIIV